MNDFINLIDIHQEEHIDINITVSEFAEKYRYIKPPGWKHFELFNFDKTPYLRYPCDCLSKNSNVSDLIVVKGTRNGATQGIDLNAIFYNIRVNPCKMFFVSADQKLLDTFTKVEFLPQLRATGLHKRIQASSSNEKNKNKSSGETSQLIEFGPNCYVNLCGANNPNNFRQLAAQLLIKDERATFPIFKKEGDAARLADGRTEDYGPYAKRVTTSTPTLWGSNYHNEFLSGTQEEWQVPCPSCGGMQYLELGKVEKDDNGRKKLLYGLDFEHENYQLRSDVKYKCKHCGISFPYEELYKINIRGKWMETKPIYNRDIVSLQLNSLYSNFLGWDRIAQVFLDAKREGTPSALQTVYNLYLGEFYEYKTNKISIGNLVERDSGYCRSELPSDVAFITCSIDVQGNRFELEFKGWSHNWSSFSIEYVKLMGNTDHHDVWNELEELIFTKRFAGTDPMMYCIDEGDGNKAEEIRSFVDRINRKATTEYYEKTGQATKKILCLTVKGASPKQVNNKPLREVDLSEYVKCIRVNTYYFKEKYRIWLSKNIDESTGAVPFGYPHFPNDYPTAFYKQLDSEEFQTLVDSNGYPVKKWVKTHTRNEPFDLGVYNIGLAHYIFEFIVLPVSKATGISDWNQMIDYYLAARKEKLN